MTTKKTTRHPTAGISLLEILIVLAVIALIMGLVAPRVIDSFGRAKGQAAEIQMSNLKGALQLMYIDIGRYPAEGEGLSLLLAAPAQLGGWRGPYLDGQSGLDDPWGRRFLYRFPGTDKDFDIYSLGRDGQTGGTREDADLSLN